MATATYSHADTELQRARGASILNVVAGIWMIAAPFVLNFEGVDNAQWNHIVVGAAVAVMAMIRASDPDRREGISWTNVVLGVWMIASPWVLNYNGVQDATTNAIVMGVIVILLGAFSAYETNQAHNDMDRGPGTMSGPGGTTGSGGSRTL